MEEGEQISTKPLQDKDHHGEILKIMRGAQGPTRMSRSGEQKDGEDKPFMSGTNWAREASTGWFSTITLQ
jgi:hypothetical protein